MRLVEKTGEPIVITDHGTPCLEIRVYQDPDIDPLNKLKGSVVSYAQPTDPVADEDWEQA